MKKKTPAQNSGKTGAKRPPRGRPFKPGQSGNPGGRPRVTAHIRELARERGEEALKNLVDICNDIEAPHAARVSAANAILDRAYGKPAQALTGEDGAPLIGDMSWHDMTYEEKLAWARRHVFMLDQVAREKEERKDSTTKH